MNKVFLESSSLPGSEILNLKVLLRTREGPLDFPIPIHPKEISVIS